MGNDIFLQPGSLGGVYPRFKTEGGTPEGHRSSLIKSTPLKGSSLFRLLSQNELLVNRMRVRLIDISHFWPKPKDKRQKGLSTIKYPVPIVAYS